MAGRRPLLNRCARPARPASHMHSLRRVDAQPDPERLAPATVLTLRRTPHACAGRCRLSSWGQKAPLAARCRCPPLPSTQLPPDATLVADTERGGMGSEGTRGANESPWPTPNPTPWLGPDARGAQRIAALGACQGPLRTPSPACRKSEPAPLPLSERALGRPGKS